MVKVNKRTRMHTEDFDWAKLKASLVKAGAKEEHATKVAETVRYAAWDGMTTAEVKRMAATELNRMDEKAATVYKTYRK